MQKKKNPKQNTHSETHTHTHMRAEAAGGTTEVLWVAVSQSLFLDGCINSEPDARLSPAFFARQSQQLRSAFPGVRKRSFPFKKNPTVAKPSGVRGGFAAVVTKQSCDPCENPDCSSRVEPLVVLAAALKHLRGFVTHKPCVGFYWPARTT